ncbi:MAG: AAA family ATPase [Pseudomonadota bacterium]
MTLRPSNHAISSGGAQPAAERSVIPNAFAIASGKGGVGKTWFATTLASAFALQGEKVIVFDGDLGLANVDVQLGLNPTHDLSAVLSGRASLEDAVATVDAGAGGFDVLAGASGSGALSSLSQHEVHGVVQGLKALAGQYDRVLIDLGAGIEANVLRLAAAAETVLVVITDEPTSLTDAYAFVKVLTTKHGPMDIRAVVNMVDSPGEGRRVHSALASACRNFLDLDLALAGPIRRDPHVKQAIRHQVPLLVRHPQADAGLDVSRIAALLSSRR